MPKNKKVKSEVKNGAEPNVKPDGKPIIRAIKINASILEAAKKLKVERGISFYRLGLESLTEKLVKEGYLKEPAAKA